jgi:hypothetical protein
MTEEFLVALETYLGIKCTHVSLIELWSQTAPVDIRDQSLPDFLRGVSVSIGTTLPLERGLM